MPITYQKLGSNNKDGPLFAKELPSDSKLKFSNGLTFVFKETVEGNFFISEYIVEDSERRLYFGGSKLFTETLPKYYNELNLAEKNAVLQSQYICTTTLSEDGGTNRSATIGLNETVSSYFCVPSDGEALALEVKDRIKRYKNGNAGAYFTRDKTDSRSSFASKGVHSISETGESSLIKVGMSDPTPTCGVVPICKIYENALVKKEEDGYWHIVDQGGPLELKLKTYPNTDVRLKNSIADHVQNGVYDNTLTSDDKGVVVFKGLKSGSYSATAMPNDSSLWYKKNFVLKDKYDESLMPIVKYSGTPNIDLNTGAANKVYDTNLKLNDIVTIPGARQLDIEVWYSTESTTYDWLAIYPAGVTPSESNYNKASISNGKLGGKNNSTSSASSKPLSSKKFTVSGDTAQFYFISDSSTGNYGYYAVITGWDDIVPGAGGWPEPEIS